MEDGEIVSSARFAIFNSLFSIFVFINQAAGAAAAGASRCCRRRRRPGTWLRAFHAVFRAADPAFFHTSGIQPSTNDVITHTRQILHRRRAPSRWSAPANCGLRPDVSNDLIPVGQAHLGDLAHRRVRLLGRARHDLNAHPASKRRAFQGWRLGLVLYFASALADS